jgi:hypothetical protein
MEFSTGIHSYTVYNDEIEFIRFDIEQNIYLFKDTIDRIYSGLKDDYLKVKKEYDASIEKANSEDQIRLYQYYSEILNEKAALIPQLIYKSLFLSIYGYYESILYNDYVENVLKFRKFKRRKKSKKNRKGKIIKSFYFEDFELLLKKKTIKIPNIDKFNFYRKLRNSFIHRNGHIDNDEIIIDLKNYSFISLFDGKINIENVKFIKDFLSFINGFTEDIMNETERKLFGRKD